MILDPTTGKEWKHNPTGREIPVSRSGTGLVARNQIYNEVYSKTRDHKAACRAYCAGNKWLEENARAVGNW